MHAVDHDQPAEEFWEEHYRGRERVWSGRANAVLVAVVADLPPGTALDLGCGEGGDAIWLAGRGWRVTAVDVSAIALARLTAEAGAAGLADAIVVERHDLARTFPAGTFDLVSAQFLHSPVTFPREEVLRAAARAVAPGGLLVVVGHAGFPPWAGDHEEADLDHPAPAEVLASLDLATELWDVEQLASPERPVTGPDGRTAVLTDSVVAVRRRSAG
jgi:SAM-dependent methyltransferase